MHNFTTPTRALISSLFMKSHDQLGPKTAGSESATSGSQIGRQGLLHHELAMILGVGVICIPAFRLLAWELFYNKLMQ